MHDGILVLVYMVLYVDLFRNNSFKFLIRAIYAVGWSMLLLATEWILSWLGGLKINNTNYFTVLTLTVAGVYIYMKHEQIFSASYLVLLQYPYSRVCNGSKSEVRDGSSVSVRESSYMKTIE
jgi:hypothetical protein